MNSAIYNGTLMHYRHIPKHHGFKYNTKMVLLDLDELDTLFSRSKLWVKEQLGFVSFRRKDYLPDDTSTVKEAVVRTVEAETGQRPNGPIYMLANLRYWGMQFNPASFFYCFDGDDQSLSAILIEVHNTPWGERHRYVLPLTQPDQTVFQFDKQFHVSPFNPMDMRYTCTFSPPAQHLSVRMEIHKNNELHFEAALKLERQELNSEVMRHFGTNAWKLPIKIMGGIYWQAVKLLARRVPFYSHP